jgi:hypothetical protein
MLKYIDPVKMYGKQLETRLRTVKLPDYVQPMTSAPKTSEPIAVWDRKTAAAKWAVEYKGNWNTVKVVRDPYTGAANIVMDGIVGDPIGWHKPGKPLK